MNLKINFKKLLRLIEQAKEKRIYLAINQEKYKGKKIIFKMLDIQKIISEYPDMDFELSCTKEYRDMVNYCLDLLELSDIDLDWNKIYYQLKNLKFRVKKIKHAQGEYHIRNNIISLSKGFETDISTVFHELLHAISSIVIDEIVICGFEYENGITAIGSGLNEGYTSILTSRFAGEDSSYCILQNLVQKLEIILMPKVMQKLYFDSNLNGLIQEISKYYNEPGEITTFLCDLDYIRNMDPKNCYEEIKNRIFRVETFLIKLMAKRSRINPFNDAELDTLDSLLIQKVKYKGHTFEFMDEEERDNLIAGELEKDLEYNEPIKTNIKLIFIAEKLPRR